MTFALCLVPVRSFAQDLAPGAVSADASPQLFATMCALYASGFPAESSGLGADPWFQELRTNLLALHGPATVALREFYRDHVLADPSATMSRYVSFALTVASPPKFEFTLKPQELPPDVLGLDGLNQILANFYQEAGLEGLWRASQPRYDHGISTMRRPLSEIVLKETGYLRELLRPGRRTFVVYAEPLVGGRINVRNIGDRYAVVVSPQSDSADQIRHAFLHFLLDPLPLRYSTNVMADSRLFSYAIQAPRLPREFRGDFSAFFTECLVRAVELRLRRLPPAELAMEVNAAEADGYVLMRPLIAGLTKFESSEPSMTIYFPDLVRSIDVAAEAKRLQTVSFAAASNQSEGGVAAKPVTEAPVGYLTPDLEAMLQDGEHRISSKDALGASTAFEHVLQRIPGQPRALYGLAVAAVLQGNAPRARQLFEEVVAAAAPGGRGERDPTLRPDPVALAWSHIYLGRMKDLEGDREQALIEYRAALEVGGAPDNARTAAQRGVEQSYEPAGTRAPGQN